MADVTKITGIERVEKKEGVSRAVLGVSFYVNSTGALSGVEHTGQKQFWSEFFLRHMVDNGSYKGKGARYLAEGLERLDKKKFNLK